MNFLIVTHVPHIITQSGTIAAYSPYVREMNLWAKHVDTVTILAPAGKGEPSQFDLAYEHNNIKLVAIPEIAFTSVAAIMRSLLALPVIILKLFVQMAKADHIHLRCPGNIGLLGCFVQIFFPGKKKTAKYAGNWDPAYKNPFSYSLQKIILSNTMLTRNMQVIVYGSWPGMTSNIKPFFTATYFSHEIENSWHKSFDKAPVFIFCGVMSERKDPFFTNELFKAIQQELPCASLHFCGDGALKEPLQEKVKNEGTQRVYFEGALTKAQMIAMYQQAHFLLFFTKTSEGWPKAVAESLFWGVIPVTKPISVVSQMLDNGNRGLLFSQPAIPEITAAVVNLWNDKQKMKNMSVSAMDWSRQYTLDKFESEIQTLL